MLVTLNEVLAYAENKKSAVGAFNTPNLECVLAVIRSAEELRTPVIIAHAQVHESIAPLAEIAPFMLLAAKNARFPVCVHLDHGEDLDYLEQALKLGFTSVMYDGSTLLYEDNVRNTVAAVKLAKKFGANVEAEIGALSSRESGETTGGAVYTDPEEAARFVADTGIDALACSFGTAHGIYKSAPKLDFERIERIRLLTGKPLVMHGGSGVSPEDYRTAIKKGVRKINYYTYMSNAGAAAAKALFNEVEVTYYHDVALSAQRAMKDDVERAMKVFALS
jgi:fructose-bisphosphate aldolase class II